MSTLGLTSTNAKPTAGFWRQLLMRKPSIFDLVFGVVGPILCFTFDPLVFRGGLFGKPLLPQFQVFVYLISGFEILTLVLWLLLREKLPAKRFLGGALLAGGVLCLTIGIAILPFTLIGLGVGIGIFGFTPFFTALVYLRSGYQAIRSERSEFVGLGRKAPVVFGCLLAIATPAMVSVAIDQAVTDSVNAVILGSADRAVAAGDALWWLRPVSGDKLSRIVDAYTTESDLDRKTRLRKSYFEITGDDIDSAADLRKHALDD